MWIENMQSRWVEVSFFFVTSFASPSISSATAVEAPWRLNGGWFYANATEQFSRRVEYLNLSNDCRRDAGKRYMKNGAETNRWMNLLSISSSISWCPALIRTHLFPTPAKITVVVLKSSCLCIEAFAVNILMDLIAPAIRKWKILRDMFIYWLFWKMQWWNVITVFAQEVHNTNQGTILETSHLSVQCWSQLIMQWL